MIKIKSIYTKYPKCQYQNGTQYKIDLYDKNNVCFKTLYAANLFEGLDSIYQRIFNGNCYAYIIVNDTVRLNKNEISAEIDGLLYEDTFNQ